MLMMLIILYVFYRMMVGYPYRRHMYYRPNPLMMMFMGVPRYRGYRSPMGFGPHHGPMGPGCHGPHPGRRF